MLYGEASKLLVFVLQTAPLRFVFWLPGHTMFLLFRLKPTGSSSLNVVSPRRWCAVKAACYRSINRSLNTQHAEPRPHHHQKIHNFNRETHSSPQSFYQNRILEQYASQETKRVTLRQLTVFGRTLTMEKLLKSANYVRTELPVRLAHRIL